jgi:hypothetical protein
MSRAAATPGEIALREAHLRGAVFEHPSWSDAHYQLECDLARAEVDLPPSLRLVCGNPGAGKSWLVEKFVERHADTREEFADRRRVILVELVEAATRRGFVATIFKKFGYSNTFRMTGDDIVDAIASQVELYGTSMILIDEAQLLTNVQREESATQLLKGLLNIIRCQFVLIGLPQLKTIIDYKELDRRLLPDINLDAYEWTTIAGQIEFRALLAQFEVRLQLPRPSDLAASATAARLYVATDGMIGFLVRYLADALKLTLERGLDYITIELLAEVYERRHPSVREASRSGFMATLPIGPDTTLASAYGKHNRVASALARNPFSCPLEDLDSLAEERPTADASPFRPQKRRTRGRGPDRPSVF